MFSFLFPVLEVIKVVMASVASVVFLGFAGVTLAGSAVALAVSTPLFIVFSPILVPATIATTLLATGLGVGTTFGVTGMGLLMRLIKHPGGAPPSGSSPGKEGAASAPAAQPSFFLSLLEMPNFITSKMLERLIHIPGFGKKSKDEGDEGESEGRKGKSKRGRSKDRKHKDRKKGKRSKGKDKDKKKGKRSKDKGKGLFGRNSRKGSSDEEEEEESS
ncbi:hypothetical protein N665_0002s0040 [Sinapis alba]|nr:hypothetical protein N665_0002s0040 [Sinapis alba]